MDSALVGGAECLRVQAEADYKTSTKVEVKAILGDGKFPKSVFNDA